MATIIRGAVPATEFALHHTLSNLDEATFEVERIVETGQDSVMPLIWMSNVDQDEVERLVDEDTSVEDADVLASFENDVLYRMEWRERIHLLVQMMTNAKATILDAFGRGDRWHLRVLYPDRDSLSKTQEFCSNHGLEFEVEAIRDMSGDPAGRHGLTDDQYRSLVLAEEAGFFEIPRETTLQELATEVDISHQALSERLRRGTSALVEDTLVLGGDAAEQRHLEDA